MKANKTKKAAILLAVTMVGSFSLSACTQRANLDDGAIEALEAIESAAETSSLEEESEDTKSESKYSIATQDAKDSADSKSTTSGSVKATETETSKASSAKKETTAKADKETSKAESEAAAKDSKTESSVSAESESAEPVPAIHEPEATPAATQALATQPAAPAATEAPETWGEWFSNLFGLGGNNVPQKGGYYKDIIRTVPGMEAHHIIPDAVSPITRRNGPAVLMTPEDHKRTASYGNSLEAQKFREQISELSKQPFWKEL